MGDLNLGQLQGAVLRAVGNVQTDHPVIAAGDHTRCINDAANDLCRLFPDRFPEHNARTWTDGPTVLGDNAIALPSNLLTLDRVTHSDGATITLGDWSSIEERIVTQSTVETIGILDKASDVTGYPILWARQGTSLLYYPTTRTGFLTTFNLYGMSREEPLVAGGDVFRFDRDFDEAVVLLGAAKLARIIGYTERAAELEVAAKRKIGEGLSVILYEAPVTFIEPWMTFDGWRN